MNRLMATLMVTLLATSAFAENYVDLVNKGNASFKQKDYKKALEYYHGAETELPESLELEYNIAGALYEQGSYEEAVDKYTRVLNTDNIVLEQQTHYNLGNTYTQMGDYQNAILSYQRALEINPNDLDAKFNLELARKLLKEQIKPEQQQQDGQQQQQQQQQPREDENAQQEQPEPDQKPQDQNAPQDQQPQQMDDKQVSREDAERILNALRDDEQDLQKKIKREVKVGEYTGKDW